MAPVQERGEATRRRLLDCAEGLFASQGYEATGVSEICAAASVSKGAFYHHFESKEEVFLSLLERWLVVMNAQLRELRSSAPDVPGSLLAMSQVIGHVLENEREKLPIYLEFWNRAARQLEIRTRLAEPLVRYQALIADMVQQGVDEGSLAPVDPAAASKTILSLAAGLLVMGLLDPSGADWGEVSHQSIAILIQGLKGG